MTLTVFWLIPLSFDTLLPHVYPWILTFDMLIDQWRTVSTDSNRRRIVRLIPSVFTNVCKSLENKKKTKELGPTNKTFCYCLVLSLLSFCGGQAHFWLPAVRVLMWDLVECTAQQPEPQGWPRTKPHTRDNKWDQLLIPDCEVQQWPGSRLGCQERRVMKSVILSSSGGPLLQTFLRFSELRSCGPANRPWFVASIIDAWHLQHN